MSRLLRWKMKIGLLRQNTLTIWPSAIGAEIDLERGAGGDGGGVRVHLGDERREGRRGADRAGGSGRDERKSRREGSAEEIVVTSSPSPRPSCRVFHPRCEPPTLSQSSRLKETEGAGPAATAAFASNLGETSTQSGGGLLAPLPPERK